MLDEWQSSPVPLPIFNVSRQQYRTAKPARAIVLVLRSQKGIFWGTAACLLVYQRAMKGFTQT
jgi:hypothetical protein